MIQNILVLPDGTELAAGTPGTNALRSLQWTHTVNAGTDLTPGSACADSIEAEIWVSPGGSPGIGAGEELALWRVEEDGTRTLAGRFTAEKPVRSKRNLYKVTAYDRMLRTEKDLSPWLRENQGEFPMTLEALVRQVAAACGVTLANTLPRNGGYVVQPFYSDGITGRQLLQWAAQAAGCYLHCTPEGELAFGWYTDARGVHSLCPGAEGAAELGTPLPYCQDGLQYEDYTTAPLDKVQIRQSDTDVGVVWPADAQGTNALVIQGNLLLTSGSDESLRPVARALYEAACTWQPYTPCTVRAFAGCKATAGELVWLVTPGGQRLQTYLMNAVFSAGETRLEATGNPRRDSVLAVNSNRLNANGKLLEIAATIDGLNVKAGNLQNDYTQLQQTVDGLELTVVREGDVRTAFAADDTSVTIQSGVITFASDTLVVDSTNFKLDTKGNVSITGQFHATDGTSRIDVQDGLMRIWRKLNDGSYQEAATLASSGSNASIGNLYLLGPKAGGGQTYNVTAFSSYAGGNLNVYNASGISRFQVLINGNGEAEVWVNGSRKF